MRKEVFFLFVFFILTISLSMVFGLTGDAITGELITGEVAAGQTNISIFVLPSAPTVSISNPENETYLSNESISLNFSTVLADNVLYNIDSASNTTITSSIFFNVSQGSHTLYLYANNSNGTTLENVTFTANSSKFIIAYSEYWGDYKGNSTAFNRSTYEDIQNLSDIILENTQHGKITFNEAINLTADSDFSDRTLNLDTNTNISSNRIELDSATLPNFDKAATLILYNLDFTDPRILSDGSVCDSSVCTENSYSGGNLSFNVTGFTVYSAEETPEDEDTSTTTSGGSSGVGGGVTVPVPEIMKLDKETISVTLKQGETKSEEIVITNLDNATIPLNLEVSGISDFINLNETSFDLEPGENKIITLDFIAKEDTVPNLYQGKLIVKSGNVQKEVSIGIEVESESPLFDVSVEIPKAFLEVVPGQELLANIKIFSLGEEGEVDVLLEYSIRDGDGNVIVTEHETVTVENQTDFARGFVIPKDVKEGDYLFYVKVTYVDKLASASAWFKVRQKTFLEKILPPSISILMIVIILAIIILLIIRLKNELQIMKTRQPI